jgi:hypothetical protein
LNHIKYFFYNDLFWKKGGRFGKKWGRFGKKWGRFGRGRFGSGGVLTCYRQYHKMHRPTFKGI